MVVGDHSTGSPAAFLRLIRPMVTDTISQSSQIVETSKLRPFAVPAAELPIRSRPNQRLKFKAALTWTHN